MENWVSWDCLTTPRFSIWRSVVMCAAFEQGGKHVRIVFRAYSTPRYPQASARKVERSEFPPMSVLSPLRNVLEYVLYMIHEKEPLGAWTE